ncbi:hypothetical protein BDD12DRAFT_481594 [Trichophaea hybrida]|nr:hypothetical protein BDD12DRAFT_481594 [Trichophaea hybrida]
MAVSLKGMSLLLSSPLFTMFGCWLGDISTTRPRRPTKCRRGPNRPQSQEIDFIRPKTPQARCGTRSELAFVCLQQKKQNRQ